MTEEKKRGLQFIKEVIAQMLVYSCLVLVLVFIITLAIGYDGEDFGGMLFLPLIISGSVVLIEIFLWVIFLLLQKWYSA